MPDKIAFQCDENGVYIGAVLADESPLEPGVWLIPSGAVEVAPPELNKEQYAQWVDGQWTVLEFQKEDPPTEEERPSQEQMVQIYRGHIQEHLDLAASALGYDDIRTAVTYAEEPAVPKFQAEGLALRAWRSLVWAHGYDLLAKFMAGGIELPSREELIEGLPKLDMATGLA